MFKLIFLLTIIMCLFFLGMGDPTFVPAIPGDAREVELDSKEISPPKEETTLQKRQAQEEETVDDSGTEDKEDL